MRLSQTLVNMAERRGMVLNVNAVQDDYKGVLISYGTLWVFYRVSIDGILTLHSTENASVGYTGLTYFVRYIRTEKYFRTVLDDIKHTFDEILLSKQIPDVV